MFFVPSGDHDPGAGLVQLCHVVVVVLVLRFDVVAAPDQHEQARTAPTPQKVHIAATKFALTLFKIKLTVILRGVVIRSISFRSDWSYFMNFRVIGLISRSCLEISE